MRCGGRFDIDRKRARVELIERESVQPGFWDDQKKAQSLGKEKSQLETALGQFEREKGRVDDALALWELAEEADDPHAREEAKVAAAEAASGIERLELARMLSGPQD
ncbi:MAG: PCRF domain-containing protein, partial [Myxococcales bacterium]